jgi:hypothetical protein
MYVETTSSNFNGLGVLITTITATPYTPVINMAMGEPIRVEPGKKIYLKITSTAIQTLGGLIGWIEPVI